MTRQAFRATVRAFEPNVSALNALNVFPVPDGDTGTNMHLTLEAAVSEIDARGNSAHDRVDQLFETITRGALMGARGNSGVILYQIIAGLNEGIRGSSVLDAPALIRGLDEAARLAYKAVTNPVEGTMLSVIRAVSEACRDLETGSLTELLETAREAADTAVQHTPEQLPVLRQAGVVDAGGQGLLVLFTALERFSKGELDEREMTLVNEPPRSFASDMHFLDQAEVIHGMEDFGYCINFAMTGENLDDNGLRQTLEALGQSTVIVGDASLVKVHTHSERPGTILEAALTFGELHSIRIDNMKSQTERLLSERHAIVEPYHYAEATEIDNPIGIIAVAAGDGVAAALKGMGADTTVAGGASMNPSIGEIREAIESLGKAQVIVLPNDKNIHASATQAAELSGVDARVVPTRSIQQALAALAAFNFDSTLDENVEAMKGALIGVKSLALTRAQRDVAIDGLEFHAGEFMGVLDGRPRVSGANALMTLQQLFADACAADCELATIFVGGDAEQQIVDDLEELLARDYPDLELEITSGGQPHYDLLIALE